MSNSVTADSTAVTLLQLLDQQCHQVPHNTAVICEGSRVSYGDLKQRSNRLANYLREKGLGRESRVGICLRRSVDMLVALMGALKAGAAYLPLDPEHPEQRIRFVLEDSNADLIITDSASMSRLPKRRTSVLCLDAQWSEITRRSDEHADVVVAPEDLAYVIYTSGSTGRPKGVMIPHRALANVLTSMAHEPGLNSSDVLLAVTTLSFDIAALELYLPLTVGARVVIAPIDVARDPMRLQRLMDECGATVMQATPVTWKLLIESGWQGRHNLKALCGGETLTRELADQLLDRVDSLWNMYGPTETTIWSMTERVTNEPGPVTIGHPIANTTIYVLNEDGELVSDEGIGELFIGGAGLALGYWNRPELTTSRFVPSRFGDPDSRLFRTGDEVRRRTDGRIEFLGRRDNQVKIRGHRVELEEVEAVLRRHALVKDCVLAGGDSGNGGLQLIAYVVPGHAHAELESAELRSYLQGALPEYMVPSVFVTVPEIPLTPNNKVDRRSLPVPKPEKRSKRSTDVSFNSDVERAVARIFEKVLEIESATPGDNFFDLGGHSLLAVQLVSEIERVLGKSVPLGDVFRAPTITGLASLLMEQESRSASCIVPIQTSGILPPFFCVHSRGSNVLNFRALANLLGSDQPFYAVEPRGLDGKSEPHYRIEDMAACYIDEMRRVQADGPYYLGGHCLGGIVALEMAQQLRAEGQQVALVALMDSLFPAIPAHFRQLARHSMFLWRVDRLVGELLARSSLQAVKYGATRISELMRRQATVRDNPAALAKVVDANKFAERSYVPKAYPGPLLLFWCTESVFRAYHDTRLAWGEIAVGGLEVHTVPGNHITMMEPPNVAVLAAKLKTCLEKSRNAGAS